MPTRSKQLQVRENKTSKDSEVENKIEMQDKTERLKK